MAPPRPPTPAPAAVAALLLAGVAGGLFVWLLRHPDVLPPKDFVEYWAAARVALDGGDPYDGAQLLPLQRRAGNEPDREHAVMMWNPPWTLPVYLPLAALDPRPAQLLWLGLQAGCVVAACLMLWSVYGGPREHVGVVPLVAVTFYGTLMTVKYGQNTGLILLGLAGFVYSAGRDRPALAGAFAALTALKPHLLAAFGVLLVLDAARPRGRVTLAVGAAAVGAGLLVALAVNPHALDEYLAALRRPPTPESVPLSAWRLPQAAYYLRATVAPEAFWVQFVPCGLACVGFAVYFWRTRRAWDWPRELPGVVWASVLTAPYGGWVFDLVVLLVPVTRAAAGLANAGRPTTIRLFAVAHVALTAATFTFDADLGAYYWVAPATLLLCLAARAAARR